MSYEPRRMEESVSASSDPVLPPIIFVGPSIPLALARRTLPRAEYRPPIKRGDLDTIPGGAVVGIIDGEFAQSLAISPGEIREAIARGVAVYGAASMGALRAAEIPRVVGIGRVFEMYRTGAIERDDEVALLFAPETYQPLTVPLINVRYAVERLVRSATLNRSSGIAIIEACSQLHYTERTYRNIFRNSKLAQNTDVEDIIKLLGTFDLKRDDAQCLLETIAELTPSRDLPRSLVAEPADERTAADIRVHDRESAEAAVMVWESGDCVDFEGLIQFLKITGAFEQFARNALGRMASAGTPLRVGPAVRANADDRISAAQLVLDATRLMWGWESPEEAHVTMRDLGLGLLDVTASLDAEVRAQRLVRAFGMSTTEAFQKAMRSELWLNELSLKREVLRLGALQYFAKSGCAAGPPTDSELSEARRCICRLRSAMRWSLAQSELNALGVTDPELGATVRDLALARRAAQPIVEAMDHRFSSPSTPSRAAEWRGLGLELVTSPKAEGSSRFSLSIEEAVKCTEQIARQMNIVRIGLIGELDKLGIHVAQAFGERIGWSTTFSSGKAETREGARVGSIMEETEIHAQDAFQPAYQIRASFVESHGSHPMVDPRGLDLPYDSKYSEALQIDWSPCIDLLGNRTALIPSACLIAERLANDIYYSPRLGGKIFSSSGLGSGFSLAEATVHAAAEYIERHALRLAEIEIDNPGGVGVRQFWFVDHQSLPETPGRIVEKYKKAGMCVRILDITSDIKVPTFYARVFDDPFEAEASMSSDGFACHPVPEVAVTMALLEAAQTKAGVIAGGREDYSLQARSLGRHERPRTMASKSQVFWFSNDRPTRSFQESVGLVTRDILEEVEWIVHRVRDAGLRQFLVVDYTMDRIRPAHTARVIIPGLESTNPLFTGARARATTIRDLLPRHAART